MIVVIVERNFLKLKWLKSYMRSTMSLDRLNRLIILFIESEMLKYFNYKILINDFAIQKVRRMK